MEKSLHIFTSQLKIKVGETLEELKPDLRILLRFFFANQAPEMLAQRSKSGVFTVSMPRSRPQPTHSLKSSTSPVVCLRVRWLRRRPGVQRRAVFSSAGGTQCPQTLSATAPSRVSAAVDDCDAQCRSSAVRRPRVSGSGRHAAPPTTSVDTHI